jgi:ferrous iron transport protein A
LKVTFNNKLAFLAPLAEAQVASVDLEAEERAWLAAVGIAVGERVTVLRHAAFGGPIHVRTAAGGEFAVGRSLAERIMIAPPPGPGP